MTGDKLKQTRSKRMHLILGALVCAWVLGACGGDDDAGATVTPNTNPVPVVDDAREIYSATMTSAEIGGLEDIISSGSTTVYASAYTVVDVAGFYQAVLPGGWSLEMIVPSEELTFVLLRQGDTVARIIIASADTFRAIPYISADLLAQYNFDQITDDEIGIVATSFTCKSLSGGECARATWPFGSSRPHEPRLLAALWQPRDHIAA